MEKSKDKGLGENNIMTAKSDEEEDQKTEKSTQKKPKKIKKKSGKEKTKVEEETPTIDHSS